MDHTSLPGAGVPHVSPVLRDLGPDTRHHNRQLLKPTAANSHLQDICIVDAHWPCLSAEIPTETVPAPLLRRFHQSTLNRIAVHVAKERLDQPPTGVSTLGRLRRIGKTSSRSTRYRGSVEEDSPR